MLADVTTREAPSASAANDAAAATLIIFYRGDVQAIELARNASVIIGRSPPADIVLRDPTLSRRHAELRNDAGIVWLRDLDSRNGTFVGSERVSDRRQLRDGSEFGMGRVMAQLRVRTNASAVRQQRTAEPPGVVVRSAALAALYELVHRVAPTDAPVLVLGESGAGKELVATALHEHSPRRNGPLRVVNCGALPGTLTEELLFGHERGAFTGADSRRKGVFEQSDGGTVFLDEIGELSAAAQAALLRVLETKRLTRLGGSEELRVNVRIVAATHRDLTTMIAAREFRADLFYRLNTLTLRVPPLREHTEDIAPLAEAFLRRASREWNRSVDAIHPAVLARLLAYPWPGNVRELRNVIERAVILAHGPEVLLEHLPPELLGGLQPLAATGSPSPAPARYRERVRDYEIGVIREALLQSGGRRARAAALLGLPLRTLAEKIRSFELDK
ncbi:MAG TPA: sigma 54-interacting transcriptional regulator [Polyangiales bacterium]|nr:sigma 54-interacting transcriptional regulator [Polyangiales bacterium]